MGKLVKIQSKSNSVLRVVLVLLAHLQFSSGHYYLEDKPCGVLYSAANYGGQQNAINDRGQFVNLGEDHDGGSNTTASLKIEQGCSLEVCSESYFNGECQTLSSGSYPVTTGLNVTDIKSVSCDCVKECKCSDIFMPRTSCARGYLQGGCRTCHALYTDFNGESDYFPPEFSKNVTAFRLRKGCTLTLYPDEKFVGEEEIFDTEIVEGYTGTIGSYECECNDAAYEPRPPTPRPRSYPPLLDIPDTLDGVINALSKDGFSNHPGLRAALKSLIGKRSSRNAYILLLGTTGAGKSSAINILFDNPNVTYAKVGGGNSTTNDIHEFRIPVPVDDIGVANSELRVIDTPGLGDTRGMERDSKFLATLDSFLENHEELKDRIPNVVLMFHKYHDNRFSGEGAQFVKMLRGFDSFRNRITDENYSNVIFVLSHFCSAIKQNTRQPANRLAHFKDVINDYASFPKPTFIVVAENQGKGQYLPMVNGYYKLPNNEYYPKNLFDKIELVTKNGGDMMGLGVFRSAFRDSDEFNVSSTTFRLLGKENKKVGYYLKLLTNVMLPVNKTEVSQMLDRAWDERIDDSLRKQFPFSLQYLQKTLNMRQITTKDDVPKTATATLELLTALKHDEATRALLDKGLNIRPPVFPQSTVAGHSYNVFKDSYLPASPFNLGDLHLSDTGFMIPKSLTCKLDVGTKENFQIFQNKEQYLQLRIQSLGIEGTISSENFTGTIKPGHNIKELSFTPDGCTLTATREFRLFEFVLNDRLDTTPEFKAAVRSLSPYDESDHENVGKWKNFFNEYGTHVVKSIYGGGAIQIRLQSNKPYDSELAGALFDIIKFAEDMTYFITTEDGNRASNRTVLKQGISHSLIFVGGDTAYHTSDLTQMSVEEASTLMTNWKKSLKFNPVMLDTEMRLEPISRIVRKLGQNYTAEIDRATTLLFKSELHYRPPKRNVDQNAAPAARPETPFLSEMLKMQQESNQKIHELMMELKGIELENRRRQEDRDQKNLEWQREQDRQEREYRQKQLELQNRQESDRQKWAQDMQLAREQQETIREENRLKHQAEIMAAQRASDRRMQEILITIANRPPPTPSCLKPGTKILMADMTERSVETLQAGDVVLDKDLNPTKVIGATYEFLLSQKFYGFNEEPSFFTHSHLFAGPSSDFEQSDGRMNLYAKSVSTLYEQNPLMEYLNVTEMGSSGNERVNLFSLESSNISVVTKTVDVFEDPYPYPEDTPIYFIQVDSPSGTYFANGYVCRHDVAPVEHWPNTMSLLFRLVYTSTFDRLAQREYSVDSVEVTKNITNAVVSKIKHYFSRDMESGMEGLELDKSYQLMTLEDVNMEECVSKIYNNPTVAALASSLYAEAGVIISRYLDGVNGLQLPRHVIPQLQHKLYDLIRIEVDRLIV